VRFHQCITPPSSACLTFHPPAESWLGQRGELQTKPNKTKMLTNQRTLEFDFSSKNCDLVPSFPRIGLSVTQTSYC
jgi:hypothetical protein